MKTINNWYRYDKIPKSILIIVDGKREEVYENQTILQALLQIGKFINHNELFDKDIKNNVCNHCSVKYDGQGNKQKIKACIQPVKEGMVILTRRNAI